MQNEHKSAKLVAQEKPVQFHDRPTRFAYALKSYTTERRETGWYVSQSYAPALGQKPSWVGPFQTIESACFAIARRLAVEVADRHTRDIEHHKLKSGDPLFGLKPGTRLRPPRGKSSGA